MGKLYLFLTFLAAEWVSCVGACTGTMDWVGSVSWWIGLGWATEKVTHVHLCGRLWAGFKPPLLRAGNAKRAQVNSVNKVRRIRVRNEEGVHTHTHTHTAV